MVFCCLTDLCGTPGYLAPEVLKVSMYDDADGYGQPVDMLVGRDYKTHILFRKLNIYLGYSIKMYYVLNVEDTPLYRNITVYLWYSIRT